MKICLNATGRLDLWYRQDPAWTLRRSKSREEVLNHGLLKLDGFCDYTCLGGLGLSLQNIVFEGSCPPRPSVASRCLEFVDFPRNSIRFGKASRPSDFRGEGFSVHKTLQKCWLVNKLTKCRSEFKPPLVNWIRCIPVQNSKFASTLPPANIQVRIQSRVI